MVPCVVEGQNIMSKRESERIQVEYVQSDVDTADVLGMCVVLDLIIVWAFGGS